MALEEVGMHRCPNIGYGVAHKHYSLVFLRRFRQLRVSSRITFKIGEIVLLSTYAKRAEQ